MIRIFGGKTAADASRIAADVMAEVVKNKPTATLGLATGSSPIGMYRELIERCEKGEISFEKVHTVNLDEYVGLSADHDQSYAYFMSANLFDHINIDKKNTNLPNGLASDPAAECARYDSVVASMGGIDMQLLGIGNNGHIGFNEPDDHFTKGTSLVKLTDSTIDANSRFFASRDLVPTHALSMGIGQIMAAERVLLIALGKGKAEILERSFFGEVTPAVPASILQFAKDVTVVGDEEALSLIREKHPGVIVEK